MKTHPYFRNSGTGFIKEHASASLSYELAVVHMSGGLIYWLDYAYAYSWTRLTRLGRLAFKAQILKLMQGEAGNLHSKREVPGRKYAIGFLGASKSGMPVYAVYNPFEFHRHLFL